MPGPADQANLNVTVPVGEAQKLYTPELLAWRVENMELTPEGTLRSVLGPCHYEPNRGGGFPAAYATRPHGLFHATLAGGPGDILLARFGGTMFRHSGWLRDFGTITSSLNNELRPHWPDQFVALHDKIIWTNGADQARVYTHDFLDAPLGFTTAPDAPSVQGPTPLDESDRLTLRANSGGYSWMGRVGTLGDVLNGETGAMLAGSWFYFAQWEDIHGNRSAISSPSSAVRVFAQNASSTTTTGADLDDLLRQFVVKYGGGTVPEHAVAIILSRTADTRRNPAIPRFLARIPTFRSGLYPDQLSAAELGPETSNNVAVPVFRVMTAHQGRLIIGNFVNDPAAVRRSEPGLAGTFDVNEWVYPDSGGSMITGLASHGDRLLAFTETSVYDLTDFGRPLAVARGVGCIAPRSISALSDGSLVWLGRDGFYALKGDSIANVSTNIQRLVTDGINRGRIRMAVSAVDPISGEYRCAVAPAGNDGNRLLLCFDGRGWRRRITGYDIDDICVTDDWRRLMLFIGRDTTNGQNGVFVLDRENATYTPVTRTSRYKSGWLRADETGLMPVNIRELYIGLVDGSNANMTVEFFRDGSHLGLNTQTDLRAIGVESWGGSNSRLVTDIAGSAVIGTSRVHQRRLFWRRVPVNLLNAETWAFEIRATYPTTRFEIAAFAFDIAAASAGSTKSRVPQRADVS